MTEKEIAEIRRRMKHDKNNITKIHGCYVNSRKEIVSEFEQTVGLLPLEANESLFRFMRRIFSGAIGKNLHDIEFSTQQVSEGEEHKLLMKLRDSELSDSVSLNGIYDRIIQTYNSDTDYLILAGCDKYDVPVKSKNDEEMDDASEEMFRYIVFAVCPVKLTKEGLGFFVNDNSFRNIGADMAISNPEIGFMFPAFDDRSTNIYNALYYTRTENDNNKEITRSVFNSDLPMPAEEQKEAFRSIVAQTADDECSYEFVQSLHDHLTEIIDEHKNTRQEEPLRLGKKDVKRVLEQCGAPEERITEFDEKYDSVFGERTEISPQLVIDTKQFEIKTPDVTIKVRPEKGYMLETRMIDGVKYIMVRAEEGVEVNGVSIRINDFEGKTTSEE